MNIAKKLNIFFSIAVATVLSGCAGLTNLTPDRLPENPSRIYTLSMSAYINDGSIVQGTIEPFVVIDEKFMPMRQISSRDGERIYELEYSLPRNQKDAKYYYLLKYKSDMGTAGIVEKKMYTKVFNLTPENRYVMNLQFDRGPIGTKVPVLGRGFNETDKLFLSDIETDTQYVSRNNLVMSIPPMDAETTYDVYLDNLGVKTWVGQFKVDAADLSISHPTIELSSGDAIQLIVDIGFKAPEGGYLVDVKTNIPSSIIMPEVIIPAGQSSVRVPVKGGTSGVGSLYLNAKGFREKIIPVEVKLASPSEFVIEKVEPKAPEVKPIEKVEPVIEKVKPQEVKKVVEEEETK